MLTTVLIVILILLLIGAFPAWPYARTYGPAPAGILWVILVVMLILLLARRTTTKDTIEHWLAEEDEQEQEDQSNGLGSDGYPFMGSGGAGQMGQQQQQMGQEQQKKAGKPKQIVRINAEAGVTGRHEKNRFAASDKGAKIKASSKSQVVAADDGHVYVHVSKRPIVDRPWVVAKAPDPLKDDDKTAHDKQSGQGAGGGESGANGGIGTSMLG
jgi:hypothetical protein